MGNVSYLLPQSPTAYHPPIVLGVQAIGVPSLFPIIFYIVSVYPLILAYCSVVVSFVLGLLPCRFLPSTITQSGLIEPEMEIKLRGYHRGWGCNFLWLIALKAFFIAGSYKREDIRNHDVEFRALLLF